MTFEQWWAIHDPDDECSGREKGYAKMIWGEAQAAQAALQARVAELAAALKPFARGHEYADAELRSYPVEERDRLTINPYDPDSPTYGDCRRAAAALKGE